MVKGKDDEKAKKDSKKKSGRRKVRITIVSTSHVAHESLQKIKNVFEKLKPDVVAVELDRGRLQAMKEGQSSSMDVLRSLGLTTFLMYFVMKKLQDWLGKRTGILPGREMLFAVDLALKNKLRVYLIDQKIEITFLKIKEISRKEKLKIVWFIIKGLVMAPFMKGGKKVIDLNKVPSIKLIEQAMGIFKKEFPSLYRILVTERNHVMAKYIKNLTKDYSNIMVVVGAGHEKGLKKLLSNQ